MDELFGDDEPKINKPRPNNNRQRNANNGQDLPQLRGNKGRKKRQEKKTEPETKKPQQQVSQNMIKCWNEQTNQQEECLLEDYVQRLYEEDKQIKVTEYPPEDDKGNVQYKFKLTDITPQRFEELTTQMKYRLNAGFGKSRPPEIEGKYRLNEGTGEAFYRIGVEDDGTPTGLNFEYMLSSLKTLYRISQKLKAEMNVVAASQGLKGKTCLVMVRKANLLGMQLEVKALLFGDSSHGKSTLLGVLKTGEFDNGEGNAESKVGKARMQVVTSQQELVTGITQSINHEVIAFDSNGKILSQSGIASWESVINLSTKILTIIDVGGHKKAEKQVISSLCSFFPEYAIVVLSALHPKINPQPMNLAVAYNLTMIVVVTHIDIAKEEMVRDTCCEIRSCLKELCPDKTPTVVKKLEDAVFMSQIVSNQEVIPIFPVSNVTGENLDVLISFLNQLPPVSDLSNNVAMPAEFLISQRFVVRNKTILAGTVIKGHINKGQNLYLGPDPKGNFRLVQIVDIRCLMVNVRYAKCGQTCTVYIIDPHNEAQSDFSDIRRGMVLVQSKLNTKAFKQFQAELRLLPKASDVSISKKCQPVVNTMTTRQICQIVFVNELETAKEPELRAKSSTNSKSRAISKLDTFESRPQITKTKSSFKLTHRNSVELSSSFAKKKQKWSEQSGQVAKPKESLLEVPKPPAIDSSEAPPKSPTLKKMKQSQTGEVKPFNLDEITEERFQKKRKEKEEFLLSASNPTSLRLRFKYNPQYITVGQKIIIKEGLFTAVGKITQLYY